MSLTEILGMSYPNEGSDEGVAVYAVFEDMCVFSRVTPYGDTVVMYPYIITTARMRHALNVREYQFFDLQTHLGYPNDIEPGHFRYLKVLSTEKKGSLVVTSTKQEQIFGIVQSIFSPYIGYRAHQRKGEI